MDVYSLNPQILPGAPLPQGEHRALIRVAIAVLVLVTIFGLIFWFTRRDDQKVVLIETKSPLHAEVLSALRSSSVQITATEIDRLVFSLSKSQTPVSDTERENVLDNLKSN